jgi:uncharacterized protein (TIGR02996 family)
MTNFNDFINTIKETPLDTTLRLIFADWLDDNYRPKNAIKMREQVKLIKSIVPLKLLGNHKRFRYRLATFQSSAYRGSGKEVIPLYILNELIALCDKHKCWNISTDPRTIAHTFRFPTAKKGLVMLSLALLSHFLKQPAA